MSLFCVSLTINACGTSARSASLGDYTFARMQTLPIQYRKSFDILAAGGMCTCVDILIKLYLEHNCVYVKMLFFFYI